MYIYGRLIGATCTCMWHYICIRMLCVCVYLYIHTYIHTYIYTYTYTYT